MENSIRKTITIPPILVFSNSNQFENDITLKIVCDEVNTDKHDGITELLAKKVLIHQLISQIPIQHFITAYGKSTILNEIGIDK